MNQDTLEKDYKLLDIDETASAEQVKNAYHRMKALYADSSLATYSLLSREEREDVLDRIERAYMRITREMESESRVPKTTPFETERTVPDVPGPEESIGSYLKRCRLELGLTYRDIAAKTRIRTTYLEKIESENLSELPAPVYLRGFVLEFARMLGVPDPDGIAASYINLLKEKDR